ncbi:hypothetical protein NPIL_375261 [Nephila pilipes]|uniref:Uncharacterized protein n=1 Tax=Nephila pilipes TaxID=299642 RepID=A0A8X6KBL3_NEPPI|nr:hypothetical protein NPIL_375261 [Nephila pilipes]
MRLWGLTLNGSQASRYCCSASVKAACEAKLAAACFCCQYAAGRRYKRRFRLQVKATNALVLGQMKQMARKAEHPLNCTAAFMARSQRGLPLTWHGSGRGSGKLKRYRKVLWYVFFSTAASTAFAFSYLRAFTAFYKVEYGRRHSQSSVLRKGSTNPAGRPKSVVVQEKITAVRELIKQDRHVTYREIEAS